MAHLPRLSLPSVRGSGKAAVVATAPLALLAGLLAVTPQAAAVATDLYFSEYVEGSSNNKAVEIYNGTGVAVDLTGYSVQGFFNGNPVVGLTVQLTGTVAPGDVFVLAAATAGPAVLAQADQTTGASLWNGDDAVTLRSGTTTLDVIGQIGFDPGTEWGTGLTSTADNTLRRKASVDGGDPVGSDVFDPAVQWDGFATDTFDGLGSHAAGTPGGGGAAAPVLTCATAVSTTAGTATTSQVSATDADSSITGLAITSAPVAGITLSSATAPAGQAATATLGVAGTTAAGTYPVQVTATSSDGATALCTVTVTVLAPLTTSRVSAVQGAGSASPLVGQRVRVEAVVTSLITSRDLLNGFFVQEEDADADADLATSEGIYVFCGTVCPTGLAAGDLVRVVGTVGEFNTSTQINVSAGSVSVLDTGLLRPSAATVVLPAVSSTKDPATFEAVEGMITTISTQLAVSEYFNLARFGEIVLTANEREFQYTQTNEPSVEGYTAYLADLATRRIVLDDASNDQNDTTTGSVDEPYFYPTPGLSTGNYVRGGDTITGLTGAMEYSFGAWKLRPLPEVDYTFASVNPRPTAPDEVGGRLQVASFNVLNYFATVDTTPSNDTGPCGPGGTNDCRGADSERERQRQLAKIVAALETIDADVFGLIEIQNDAGLATQQIVDALNAATAPGTYDYIETGTIGTDAIKQAFLYKTATVKPVGDYELLTSEDDPRFIDRRNRPALIQTFDEIATGERVTVAVNHLKSKGSGCGAGDDSVADGSGNCDLTRTQAAAALADFLATDPTGSGDPDFLVIGDLNSYSQERPITTLEGAGYVDLLEREEGLESYGYVFDGLLGHLDHALATTSLADQVTGAGGWKINADEFPLLDYNDDIKDAGEAAFERESSALPLYEPTPYRSSDHDPVVVGLSLDTAPVADAGGPYTVKPGARIVLDASGSFDLEGEDITFAWDLDGDGQFDDATGPTAVFRGNRPPGRYEVAVKVSDADESTIDTTYVEVLPRGLQL